VLAAVLAPILTGLLQWLLWPAISSSAWILFVPSVLLASRAGGFRAGLAAAALSTVIVWFAFLPPIGVMMKANPAHLLSAGIYLAISVILSLSTSDLRTAGRELRAGEAGLRRSESRLNKAQQIAHVGSWEFDVAANRVAWSDEVYRIFGLKPQEFDATYEAFLASVHPDDRTAVDAAFTVSLREKRDGYRIEHRIVKRDTGENRTVLSQCEHLRDAAGQVIRSVGTVHDITELKQIEETLRDSEERFRLIVDEAPIGIVLAGLDGRYIRVNEAFCEIVGYSSAELTGMDFRRITPRDDVEKDLATQAQAVQRKIAKYRREKHYIRKDGSLVDVIVNGSVVRDHDGRPIYYIGQVEDVTERKRSEEALRLSEAKFSGIVSLSDDAIISIDEERKLTLFNRGAENIFGYAQDEVLGKTYEVLLADRFRAAGAAEGAGLTGADVFTRRAGERSLEIVGRRKNGEEFPAEASITRLEVGGGELLSIVLRDVTESRRVAREQRFLAEAGAVLTSSLDYAETLKQLARLAVREIADFCAVYAPDETGRLRSMAIVHADPARQGACERLAELYMDKGQLYFVSSVTESNRSTVWTELNEEFSRGPLPAASGSPYSVRSIRNQRWVRRSSHTGSFRGRFFSPPASPADMARATSRWRTSSRVASGWRSRTPVSTRMPGGRPRPVTTYSGSSRTTSEARCQRSDCRRSSSKSSSRRAACRPASSPWR
jgi:PAS domain S-box-containing protein